MIRTPSLSSNQIIPAGRVIRDGLDQIIARISTVWFRVPLLERFHWVGAVAVNLLACMEGQWLEVDKVSSSGTLTSALRVRFKTRDPPFGQGSTLLPP